MWQMNNLGIDFHSMGIFSQHFFQSIVVVIICDNRNALQDTDTGHDCYYFDNRFNRAR